MKLSRMADNEKEGDFLQEIQNVHSLLDALQPSENMFSPWNSEMYNSLENIFPENVDPTGEELRVIPIYNPNGELVHEINLQQQTPMEQVPDINSSNEMSTSEVDALIEGINFDDQVEIPPSKFVDAFNKLLEGIDFDEPMSCTQNVPIEQGESNMVGELLEGINFDESMNLSQVILFCNLIGNI